MIDEIIELLVCGVHVSIVTAAGYPGDSSAFEARIRGLLDAFASRQLQCKVTNRFSLLGGECNYLLKCALPSRRAAARLSPLAAAPMK